MEKKDDTRRVADLHLQTQLPVLSHRIGELERIMREKFNGYLDQQFNRMYSKINDLQCGVHIEKINNLEKVSVENMCRMDKKINGMYIAFFLIFIAGLGLHLWTKGG